MGNAEIIRSKIDKKSGLIHHIDHVLDAAQRSAALVSELLTFARKVPHELHVLDANKKLHQVVEILKHTVDRRIKIIKKFNAKEPFILGDRHYLQNAFLNVAINSRDAMPTGGEIVIASENVNIDAEYCKNQKFSIKEGDYVQVTISDTGTGMDENTLAHIFEPFFTTKKQGKGTGLGLSSVFGCIKLHNGFIHVESEVNKGTICKMYLPQVKSSGVKDEKSHTELIKGSGNILVVDDEEIIRDAITSMLSELGYKVTCCTNGKEAVEKYSQAPSGFDLVLLDMIMPEMSGKDCFEELRRVNPSARIIICSGYSMDDTITALLKRGASGYIAKPFQKTDVSIKVTEVMKKI